MAKKSKFIKNLLTTASTAAIFFGSASGALGVALEATVNADAYDITAATNVTGAYNDNNALKYNVNNASGTTGGNVTLGGIDINAKRGLVLTVSNGSNLGSIGSGTNTTVNGLQDGNNPDGGLKLIVTDGKGVTLTGINTTSKAPVPVNTYVGLREIQLGTGGGVGRVIINMTDTNATTLFAKIDSQTANNGVISMLTSTVFKGAIGQTGALDNITINAANKTATFEANAKAKNFVFSNNAGVKIEVKKGAHLEATDNGITVAAAGKGSVTFDATGAANGYAGKITAATVGSNAAGDVLTVTGGTTLNGVKQVTGEVAGKITMDVKFMSADDYLKISAGTAGNRTISNGNGAGGIYANGTDGFGILEFETNGQINSKIGNGVNQAIGELRLNNGSVSLKNNVYKAQTVSLTENSELLVGNAATVITGNIINRHDKSDKGTIKFEGANNVSVIGDIGSEGKALAKLDFQGNDNAFSVTGTRTHINSIAQSKGAGVVNAAGKLEISAILNQNSHVLKANSADDNYMTEFNIKTSGDNQASKVELTGKLLVAATSLKANHSHELTLKNIDNNGSSITGTNLKFNAADQKLTLEDKSALSFANNNGIIANTANGDGKIVIEGEARIKATKIGTAGNGINEIELTGADKTFYWTNEDAGNATGLHAVNGIKFTADATIDVKSASAVTIKSNIINATNANGTGSIVINAQHAANLIISGNIGDKAAGDNALKLLSNLSNATIAFDTGTNVHIKELSLGNNSQVTLDKINAHYRFDKFTLNNNGKIKVNKDNITLQTGNLTADQLRENTDRWAELNFGDNHKLIVDDSSVLRAVKMSSSADGANNGQIEFAGNAVFDAPNNNSDRINSVTLSGSNGKVVDYRSDLYTLDGVTINNTGATFDFSGAKLNNTNNGVRSNNPGGILKLSYTAGNQEIIGNINLNTHIQYAGSNVKFNNVVSSNKHKFTNTDAITVTFDNNGTSLNAFDFEVVPENITNTVLFSTDAVDFGGSLGGGKSLILRGTDAVNTITVSANAGSEGAQFETLNENANLILNAAANEVKIKKVGTAQRSFSGLFIRSHTTISDDVYANNIKIEGNQNAQFGGDIKSSKIELNNDLSKVIFQKDGLVLSTPIENIRAGGAAAGVVEFADINAEVKEQIGSSTAKVAAVKFGNTGEKEVILGADIHATEIETGAGVYSLGGSNVRFNGSLNAAGSRFEFGTKKLESLGGDATFSGATTFVATVNPNNLAEAGGLLNSAGRLSFADGATLSFDINDPTIGIPREDVTITLLENTGSTLDEDTISFLSNVKLPENFSNANSLAKWTITYENNKLLLKRANNAEEVIAKTLENLGSAGEIKSLVETTKLLVAAPKDSDAGRTSDILSRLLQSSDEESKRRGKEGFERIQVSTEGAQNQVLEEVGNMVSSRMAFAAPDISGFGDQISPESTRIGSIESGVSAGDMHERYGVWGSPFFSNSIQKARKGASGYKGDSYGLTVGFDTKVNDDMLLGAAATYANTDVKHRDIKKGDRSKIDSYMLSVYGMQQLTTNWFVMASGTVGSNHVKNNSLRVTGLTTDAVATGKYNSMSFAGEVLAGYNYLMSSFAITPMVGVKYSRVNDGGYKESGTATQNLDISKKASNKFDVIAGLRLSGSAYDMGGFVVTPEVHGFVHHDLIAKNPEVDIKIDGVKRNIAQTSAKATRTFFNAGVGATARYGMMEYGATYDAHLANKFTGHQGTLKIRVNF